MKTVISVDFKEHHHRLQKFSNCHWKLMQTNVYLRSTKHCLHMQSAALLPPECIPSSTE